MATKITLRGDTRANWESVNPILSAREMVIETDTNRTKIGDGVKTYTQLGYASNGNTYTSMQVSAHDYEYPEIKNIDYVRLFSNAEGKGVKLSSPHAVGKEYYIKNPTKYSIELQGIGDNINGQNSIYLPPYSFWHLVKEDNGTNSITAFNLTAPTYNITTQSYKAKILQSGTGAPTVGYYLDLDLQGFDLVWSRNDVGVYNLTAQYGTFDVTKIHVTIDPLVTGGDVKYEIEILNNTTVRIVTSRVTIIDSAFVFTPGDGLINGAMVSLNVLNEWTQLKQKAGGYSTAIKK